MLPGLLSAFAAFRILFTKSAIHLRGTFFAYGCAVVERHDKRAAVLVLDNIFIEIDRERVRLVKVPLQVPHHQRCRLVYAGIGLDAKLGHIVETEPDVFSRFRRVNRDNEPVAAGHLGAAVSYNHLVKMALHACAVTPVLVADHQPREFVRLAGDCLNTIAAICAESRIKTPAIPQQKD